MKQRVRFILALLLMAVQGVWAWAGEGTSTNPYLIQNLTDWKQFSNEVLMGENISGKYFRLTTNINIEDQSVGSSWQRTNNISKGAFEDDDAFAAFACYAAATPEDQESRLSEIWAILSEEGIIGGDADDTSTHNTNISGGNATEPSRAKKN